MTAYTNSIVYPLAPYAPYVFTNLLKPVIRIPYRQKLVVYLDDIVCFGPSYDECVINVKNTIKLLESLGFMLNKDKIKQR